MTTKNPLLHFLLIGAVLYALSKLMPLPSGADWDLRTIHVSVADQRQLSSAWLSETGRRPSAAELHASVQRHVDDEVLLREALRLELHTVDSVVRRRLIANMRFAFPDSQDDDAALLSQALALGMHEQDLVVRRRLVQMMQMRIVSDANISEAQLRDYIAEHPHRYATPRRFAFRHLYFNDDAATGQAQARAETQLARLQAGNTHNVTSDSFLLGEQFSLRSEKEISRQFGSDFARAITQLKPGQWAGPIRSPYGLHLVKVEQAADAAEADYERVSASAAYALLNEHEQQVLREALARLRLRYRIELAAPPTMDGSEVPTS